MRFRCGCPCCRNQPCQHKGRWLGFRVADADALPDAADRAVAEWVRSWRETAGPDAQRPPLTFAGVLGSEAVSMQREGVPMAEMVRIFSAAGRDGESPSGVPAVNAP